jgi:hypothetical protein
VIHQKTKQKNDTNKPNQDTTHVMLDQVRVQVELTLEQQMMALMQELDLEHLVLKLLIALGKELHLALALGTGNLS